jgi:hypothetical protein
LAGENTSIAAKSKANFMVDPFTVSKAVGISLIALISVLLIVDYLSLRKRGVFRLTSHYVAHLAVLSVVAAGIINSGPGAIL